MRISESICLASAIMLNVFLAIPLTASCEPDPGGQSVCLDSIPESIAHGSTYVLAGDYYGLATGEKVVVEIWNTYPGILGQVTDYSETELPVPLGDGRFQMPPYTFKGPGHYTVYVHFTSPGSPDHDLDGYVLAP